LSISRKVLRDRRISAKGVWSRWNGSFEENGQPEPASLGRHRSPSRPSPQHVHHDVDGDEDPEEEDHERRQAPPLLRRHEQCAPTEDHVPEDRQLRTHLHGGTSLPFAEHAA
jgi:hypothetical protein